jgi:ABC-type Fe3+/spermidine/putrescine transport system ATPase subunit
MSRLHAEPSSAALLHARLRGNAGSLAIDVAFEIRKSWTALFGPSGAGKSTVLRALCGLALRSEQHVVMNDADLTRVPPHRRRIAMVSQDTALFPHMTALENVLFGLRVSEDLPRSERASEAHRLLACFHAGDTASKYPRMLSGGEQQRVALARAIASSPRVLLLDEAFTGLHTHLRTELVDEIKLWQRDTGVPVISVTHDVAEALACADEVLRIADGRIVAQGKPQDVLADERATLLHHLG